MEYCSFRLDADGERTGFVERMLNESEAARYLIDTNQSCLLVHVTAGGLLSSFGHNPTLVVRDFDGEVTFWPNQIARSALDFRVNCDSLTVAGSVSDQDRKEIEQKTRLEVLESDKYPQVIFFSEQISAEPVNDIQYKIKIIGNLSLHGVTHRISIDTLIALESSTLKAQGQLWLRQSDFNIKLISALGGMLKVRDQIEIEYTIIARQITDSAELVSGPVSPG